MSKKKYNVLDLFCGCGGLSRGFIDADFSVSLGVDVDELILSFDQVIVNQSALQSHQRLQSIHLLKKNIRSPTEKSKNAVLFVTKSMREATCGNKKRRCIFRFRKAGQEFFEEEDACAAARSVSGSFEQLRSDVRCCFNLKSTSAPLTRSEHMPRR